MPAYALASLVGAQRVYTNEHWTSDVVASAALAVLVGRWTEERLRRLACRTSCGRSPRPIDVRDTPHYGAPSPLRSMVSLPLSGFPKVQLALSSSPRIARARSDVWKKRGSIVVPRSCEVSNGSMTRSVRLS